MAIGFFTAALGFVLTTLIREIVILRRRSHRTGPQKRKELIKKEKAPSFKKRGTNDDLLGDLTPIRNKK